MSTSARPEGDRALRHDCRRERLFLMDRVGHDDFGDPA
jgi:hypothetical protein